LAASFSTLPAFTPTFSFASTVAAARADDLRVAASGIVRCVGVTTQFTVVAYDFIDRLYDCLKLRLGKADNGQRKEKVLAHGLESMHLSKRCSVVSLAVPIKTTQDRLDAVKLWDDLWKFAQSGKGGHATKIDKGELFRKYWVWQDTYTATFEPLVNEEYQGASGSY
jgi:hypothetical protein